ncbi:hypothetical protein CR513_20499, partial [Mucuna pruriens]
MMKQSLQGLILEIKESSEQSELKCLFYQQVTVRATLIDNFGFIEQFKALNARLDDLQSTPRYRSPTS